MNNLVRRDPVDALTKHVQDRFAHASSNFKGYSIVGVIVAYGDDVAWGDIFASPEMFRIYWPKLLRSHAVEALARPKTGEQASIDAAYEFLQPLAGDEISKRSRRPTA